MKPEEGLIPLSIFTDREIYELELRNIFRRSWLFLGFESMVRNKGDYIKTYMGEIPVIVVRDQNGNVRVFLDVCPHRGMQLVRGYRGNSLFFKCPYHGWTFSADGKFISAPYYEEGYEGIISKDEWGLKEVKNIKLYKGTIWATLEEKPKKSFEEYLGDMRLYLDILLELFEGEIEVYGGISRWLIPANWKTAAENFGGDSYHPATAHATARVLGLRPNEHARSSNNRNIRAGVAGIITYAMGLGRHAVDVEALRPFRERIEERVETLSQKYGPFVKSCVPMTFTIFPNFTVHFTWNFALFRVWHPRGPNKMLMEQGLMMFKDLPEEAKKAVLRRALHEFGPAGLLEQDDAEMWLKIALNADHVRRHGIDFGFNYMRGLGREVPAEKLLGDGARGIAAEGFSELGIRNFYSTWKKYMLGEEP